MIEIADASQVSRATLYNHYRDKSAVISALITAEVEFMIDLANKAGTPADALERLSLYISTDGALSAMRIHDKAVLSEMLSHPRPNGKLFLPPGKPGLASPPDP